MSGLEYNFIGFLQLIPSWYSRLTTPNEFELIMINSIVDGAPPLSRSLLLVAPYWSKLPLWEQLTFGLRLFSCQGDVSKRSNRYACVSSGQAQQIGVLTSRFPGRLCPYPKMREALASETLNYGISPYYCDLRGFYFQVAALYGWLGIVITIALPPTASGPKRNHLSCPGIGVAYFGSKI